MRHRLSWRQFHRRACTPPLVSSPRTGLETFSLKTISPSSWRWRCERHTKRESDAIVARVCGIDPGVQPVMALIDMNNGVFHFFDDTWVSLKRGKGNHSVPRPALIRAQLEEWKPDLVIIEEVQPRGAKDGRKVGLASTAWFLHSRGVLEGVCAGMGLMYELVSPQKWQRDLRVKGGPDNARAALLQMYPLLAPELKRKKDHNRAAAMLLAIWGEKHHPLF